MERSVETRIVVLLLFVAFAVAGLGGTWLIQRQFTADIEQNQEVISNFNQSLIEVNENLYDIAIRVDEIESDTSAINSIVQVNEYIIITLQEETEYLSNRLDNLETEFRLEIKTNQEYVDKISDLKEHIDKLYLALDVAPENKLYVDNEIMFEYPRDMNISESGLILGDASDYSGTVFGTYDFQNDIEIFISTWDSDLFGIYSEFTSIDDETATNDLKDIGFKKITLQESRSTKVNGHDMDYWVFSAKYEQMNCTGVYGGWYCPQNKRIHYIVAYKWGESDSISFLDDILASFRCHE